MAQFDVLRLVFPLPQSDDQPAELTVVIDNPETMQIDEVQQGTVPEDVEIVSPGETPTQELYVYADHHQLTITLAPGDGENPLAVPNTGFFNEGENEKYLDIVVAEKDNDGKKKTRKIRTKGVVVFD